MKKILAFAAIALVAIASQAASVTWTSGTMYIAKDANGTWATANTDKAKGGLATAQYLIVDSDTYDTYVGNGEKMYNDWNTLASAASVKSDVISSSGGATANWNDPTNYTKADGTVYALALFRHTSEEYGDFYIAATGSGFVNDLGDFEGTYGSLASVNKPWVKVPAAPGPIDVPEPTSLALIALGVAAFGLKRKHA